MFLKVLVFALVCSFNTFAAVQGKYEVSLTGHALFSTVKFNLDSKGSLLDASTDHNLGRAINVRSSFNGVSEYNNETGFLNVTFSWDNDGSRELTKIEIFVSNDAHFGNQLVSVATMYSDGSTVVSKDAGAVLNYNN